MTAKIVQEIVQNCSESGGLNNFLIGEIGLKVAKKVEAEKREQKNNSIKNPLFIRVLY